MVENKEVNLNFQVSGDAKCLNAILLYKKNLSTSKLFTDPYSVRWELSFELSYIPIGWLWTCFVSKFAIGTRAEKLFLEKNYYAIYVYISSIKELRAFIWYMNDKTTVENTEVIQKFIFSCDVKCQNAILSFKKILSTSKWFTDPFSAHWELSFELSYIPLGSNSSWS